MNFIRNQDSNKENIKEFERTQTYTSEIKISVLPTGIQWNMHKLICIPTLKQYRPALKSVQLVADKHSSKLQIFR